MILTMQVNAYTLATNTSADGPHTFNITTPNDAVLGDTLMRVSVVYNASPSPYGLYGDALKFDEVDD